MKHILFIICILACLNATAQQAPGAVTRPSTEIPKPPPPMAVSRSSQSSNEELNEIIRAQTNAIKALSSKLDSLEERVGKIERERR